MVSGSPEFEKYTCEGLLRTLRMFGMVLFCAHQVYDVMLGRRILIGCVDNPR